MIAREMNDEARIAARKSWTRWLLYFAPLMTLFVIAVGIFGLAPVLPILAVMVVATFAYQRLVNRRSWQSIFLGDQLPRR